VDAALATTLDFASVSEQAAVLINERLLASLSKDCLGKFCLSTAGAFLNQIFQNIHLRHVRLLEGTTAQ
jgi:hypothetical protein